MIRSCLIFMIAVAFCGGAFAQATTMSYQGSLKNSNLPANGNYDFEFDLYTAETGGTFTGGNSVFSIPVVNGYYGVVLTYPMAAWNASPKWMQIYVKPAGTSTWQQLDPRQPITQTPYAIKSATADSIGGIAPTGFVQNTTTQQPASNFNISGNGNIGGRLRVEGVPGGQLASFGGNGSFQIDASGFVGGRLTVNENGNVGIGTSSPVTKLDVTGPGVVRARVDGDSNAGLQLALNGAGKWSVATVTGGQFQIFNDAIGQNAVWINSTNNNFGIGTSNPISKLHVAEGTSAFRFSEESGVSTLRVENSAVDSRSVISLGDDATAWQLRIDGPTPNPQNFFDTFSIRNASSNQVALTICCQDLPRVGIGITNPTVTFEVKPGGSTLADSWNTRSSARLKDNIQTISSPLEKILRLRGVAFDYKGSGKHSLGFIAEEVGNVLPEVVEFEPNSKNALGLDYSRITPVVVEAMKEQQSEIDLLKKLVENQQNEIEMLKKQIRSTKRPARSYANKK